MPKLQSIYLITSSFIFINFSCNQNNNIKESTVKTGNYVVGDCLEFKKTIKDFGVIFLDEKVYPDGKQYNLFPVKLDTTKTGIEKFKNGKVYISNFIDFTKPSGRTEGFMVYHFLNQKNFESINNFFNYIGNIPINDDYINSTGGTMASNFDEFRFQLNHWDKMFGEKGRLVAVSEITP